MSCSLHPDYDLHALRNAAIPLRLTVACAVLLSCVGCQQESGKSGTTVVVPTVTPTVTQAVREPVGASENSASQAESDPQTVAATDQPAASQTLSNQTGSSKVDTGQTASVRSKPQDDKLHVINFDHLNLGMQPDVVFRPRMLEYNDGLARSLVGKRINIAGYMAQPDKLKGMDDFILLKNLECKFGPGGQADHLVHVVMQGKQRADFTDKVIYVEGELELKTFPELGPTWSIYDLKATKVSTRKPPRQ